MSEGFGFGSFASLRKSAAELSAKAAASVNEYKTKQLTQDAAAAEEGGAPAPIGSGSGHATEEVPKVHNKTGDNASKQELLEILGKMNKKLKALTLVRQQLTQQLEEEQKASSALKTLVLDEILMNPPSIDGSSSVSEIQKAWRQKEEQDALVVQSLQQEFQRMQQQQQQQQTDTLEDWKEAKQMMIDQHSKEMAVLKKQHEAQLLTLSSTSSNNVDMISKEAHETALAQTKEAHEATLKSFKEKVVQAQKAQAERLRLEKDEALEKQRVELEQSWTAKLTEQSRRASTELEALKGQQHTASDELVQRLQSEKDALEKQLDGKEKQLTTLTEQWSSKQKQLRDENMEGVQRLKDEILEMKNQLNAAQEQTGALKKRLESKEKELSTLTQLIEDHVALAKDLKGQIHQFEEKINRKERELSTLSEQMATNEKQLRENHAAVVSGLKDQIYQLEKQLVASQEQAAARGDEQMKEYQASSKRLEEEVEILRGQLSEKVTVVQGLRDQVASLLTELKQKDEQLEVSCAKLEQVTADHATVVNRLEEETRKLMLELSQKEEKLSVQNQQIEQIKADNIITIKALKDQVGSLQNELKQKELALALKDTHLSEKDLALASRDNELTKLRRAHAEELSEVKEQVSNLQASATDGSENKAIVEQLQAQQVNLEQAKRSLQDELATSQQQLNAAQLELRTATQSHEQLAACLQQQVDSLQKDLSEAEERATVRQEEVNDARTAKHNFGAELADTRAKLQTLINSSEQHMANLRKELSDTQERMDARKKEVDDIKAAKQIVDTQLAAIRQQLLDNKAQFQASADSGQQQLANLKKELLETQERAKAQEKDVNDAKAAKQRVETELTAVQQQLVDTKAKLQDSADSNQQQLTKLKKNLSEAQEQIASIQKHADAVQGALDDKTQQVEALQKQLASNEALLALKTKELDEAHAASGSQNQQLWRQLESLQKQLSDKQYMVEAKTKELGEQKSQLTKKLEILQTQLVEKEQLVVAKTKNLDDSKGASADQIRQLAEQLEMLQSKLAEKEHLLAAKTQELSKQKEQVEALQKEVSKQERLVAQKSKDIDVLKAELSETLAEARMAKQAPASGASKDEMNKALASQQDSFQAKLQQLQQMNSEEIERISNEHVVTIESMKKEHEVAVSALTSKAQALEKKLDEINSKAQAETAGALKEKDELRKKMEEYVDKMTAQFKAKLKALHEKAEAESKRFETDKEALTSKLMLKLKDLQDKYESDTNRLQAEKEDINAKLSAQLRAASLTSTALKNENEDLKNRLARAKEEMKMTIENNSSTATSLIEQQEKLEREKGDLEALCQSLEAENQAQSKTLEDLQGKIIGLEQSLSTLSEEKYEQDLKIQSNARIESKLRASQAEVTDLREQLNKLKLEHTKNSNLVARLQADKDSTERTHGERTALVAMLETQLSDMNEKNADINARMEATLYDLSQKEETIIGQQEQLQRLERELARIKEVAKRTSDALALAQKGGDLKSSKQVEALQRELQATKQQMAKKSAAAQKMFQEREAECAELRKMNKALQQEVDRGTLSDRRIFELAAKQSNRESHQVSEIEIRDRVIDNLKMALLERDGDLAFFEKHVQEVEGQVEELCRVRRREDVNLDYLKSVVVKYLSLPPGSSERARLLPVLATLLQFNNDDYHTIEDAKNKLSWWGSIAPTLIGSTGEEETTVTTSAEVSVTAASNGNGAVNHPSQHRTSLQF